MAPITLPTGQKIDPTQYKYYNSSFYKEANPYDDFNKDMDTYASGAYNSYNSILNSAPWQRTSGNFKWGAVNPSDSRIGDIMGNLRGGQQNLMQDYINRAADAGVSASRGGYGLAGTNPEAGLSQQALKELASQYSGDYWKTLNLLDQDAARMLSAYGTALSSTAGLAGDYAKTRLGGVQGGSDWLMKLLNMQREDYGKDVAAQQNWELQGPQMEQKYRELALQLEQQQQQQQQKQNQDDAMAYARQYVALRPYGSFNDPEYAYYFGLLKNAQDLQKGVFGTFSGRGGVGGGRGGARGVKETGYDAKASEGPLATPEPEMSYSGIVPSRMAVSSSVAEPNFGTSYNKSWSDIYSWLEQMIPNIDLTESPSFPEPYL
jgi:hypothetical protein